MSQLEATLTPSSSSAAIGGNRTTLVEDDRTAMAKAAVIVDSIAFPVTMKTVIELGLLEIIANKGPITASEVVIELKTDNPLAADMVERMLCLLATFSVVSCSIEVGRGKVFGMTAVGRYFVKDEDGVSMAPVLRMLQDKVFMDGWNKQAEAILEGAIPFDRAHGMNLFEYLGIDTRFNEIFIGAMMNYTTVVMKKFLKSYKGFENVKKLVDVGGGVGHNLMMIMTQYPAINGINFDLPHVVEHGLSYPGLEHVSGDMFQNIPMGDAIFMKFILLDWDDEHCLILLKKCYKVLPPSGKVVVIELIMEEEPEVTLTAQVVCQRDIVKFTFTPGGRERSTKEYHKRTTKEYLTLVQAAGFLGIRFDSCICGMCIMEFYK